MKRIIIAALVGVMLLCVVPSMLFARNFLTDPANSYYLIQHCREPAETPMNGWCQGYISGVLETLQNLKHESVKCVPRELMRLLKIITTSSKVRTWVEKNKKRREMSATSIVTKVIRKTWPCPT